MNRRRSEIGPEPTHPYGWIGYVVADGDRTSNALRLVRWVVPMALFGLLVVAAVVVVLVLSAPLAAGLAGGGSTMTAAGLIVGRARRRGQQRRR